MRKVAVIAVGFLALVINPYVGCGEEDVEPEFQFNEAEMREAIVGTWRGTLTYDTSGSAEVTLVLTQAEPASAQGKCGTTTRSFILPAGACADLYETSMQLTGILDSDDGLYEGVAVEGTLILEGLAIERGELYLEIPASASLRSTFRPGTLEHGVLNGWDQSRKRSEAALELHR